MLRRLFLSLCVLCLLAACQQVPRPHEQLLGEMVIAVAPFTQPIQDAELLAGYIPERQGRISLQDLSGLDDLLVTKLNSTNRSFRYLSRSDIAGKLGTDARGRRSALATWMQRARRAGADLILVPQIVDWRERVGGTSGVISPAAVTVDFFLVDAREPGRLLQRSHYAQEQRALANDLTTFREFAQRKGRWISASEMVGEAMDNAIQELGL